MNQTLNLVFLRCLVFLRGTSLRTQLTPYPLPLPFVYQKCSFCVFLAQGQKRMDCSCVCKSQNIDKIYFSPNRPTTCPLGLDHLGKLLTNKSLLVLSLSDFVLRRVSDFLVTVTSCRMIRLSCRCVVGDSCVSRLFRLACLYLRLTYVHFW